MLRGYALNVRTRIKIISVAWARTVIQLGRVASSTSTQPPSSDRRSTISVAMNHPAAAARRSKKLPPPRQESPGRAAKTNAAANITKMSSVNCHPGVVSQLVLPGSLHLLLSPPGIVRLLMIRSPSPQERIAVATGGGRIGYFERFCHCCYHCGGGIC
jgi:hypothetical protein